MYVSLIGRRTATGMKPLQYQSFEGRGHIP
jgi:hypothetical protein